jgi:hypothetical protein
VSGRLVVAGGPVEEQVGDLSDAESGRLGWLTGLAGGHDLELNPFGLGLVVLALAKGICLPWRQTYQVSFCLRYQGCGVFTEPFRRVKKAVTDRFPLHRRPVAAGRRLLLTVHDTVVRLGLPIPSKRKPCRNSLSRQGLLCRGDWIRTSDLLNPIQEHTQGYLPEKQQVAGLAPFSPFYGVRQVPPFLWVSVQFRAIEGGPSSLVG